MAFKGKNIILKIDTGGGFTPVAYMKGKTVTINNETVDVTTSDAAPFRELLGDTGLRSFATSGATIYRDNGTADFLNDAAMNGDLVAMEIVMPSGFVFKGSFLITSFEYNAEMLDTLIANMSFEGSGIFIREAFTYEWVIGAGAGQVYISSDGDTWTLADAGGSLNNMFTPEPTWANGTWIIGGSLGVFRSTDSGATWVEVGAGVIAGSTLGPGITTDGNGTWLVAGSGGNAYRSIDDGLTWVAKPASGAPAWNHIYSLAYNPTTGAAVGIGIYGAYITTDWGDNWTFSAPVGWTNKTGYGNTYGNGIFMAGTDLSRIYQSGFNNTTFTEVINASSLFSSTFRKAAYNASDDIWIVPSTGAAGLSHVYKKESGVWTDIGPTLDTLLGAQAILYSSVYSGGVWFMCGSGVLVKSIDNGDTWTDELSKIGGTPVLYGVGGAAIPI